MTLQAKLAAALYALWYLALLVIALRASRIGRGVVARPVRLAASALGALWVLVVWGATWNPSVHVGSAQCIAEPAVAFGGSDLLDEPDCVVPVTVRALELGAAAALIVALVAVLLRHLARRRQPCDGAGRG